MKDKCLRNWDYFRITGTFTSKINYPYQCLEKRAKEYRDWYEIQNNSVANAIFKSMTNEQITDILFFERCNGLSNKQIQVVQPYLLKIQDEYVARYGIYDSEIRDINNIIKSNPEKVIKVVNHFLDMIPINDTDSRCNLYHYFTNHNFPTELTDRIYSELPPIEKAIIKNDFELESEEIDLTDFFADEEDIEKLELAGMEDTFEIEM